VIGWGPLSLPTTTGSAALVEVLPHKPLASPHRDYSLSSDTLLQVNFEALNSPEDGGAMVVSYNLQYDDASKGTVWTDLTGHLTDDVSLSFGVTSSIQVGKTYLFKYRAKNIHGWGPYSDSLSLIAARVADEADSVVTSNEGTYVKISWTEPAYDGGTYLTGFRILIKTASDSFEEDLANCDARDQTVKANQFCLIPMITLRNAPFSLSLAELVAAKVISLNLIGESTPSQENTAGALIRTEPLKPVTLVERYDSGTTDTRITITYSNLLDQTLSGGSPVLSLNLYWDQGIGLWVSLTGAAPFYTLD